MNSVARLMLNAIWGAALILMCTQQVAKAEEPSGWDLLPAILAEIQEPQFPDKDFPITEFGAKLDGQTDCKPAIDKAIESCVAAGGGRVTVPKGQWFVKGPIHLKSNVNLHVAEGATVLFSNDPADYLPVVFTRFEGTELMNYSPLIYAYEQKNIAVTGKGTLNGQAGDGKWWNWKGHWGGETDIGWKKGDPDQMTDVAALG